MPLFKNFFKQASKSHVTDANDDISQVENRTQSVDVKNKQENIRNSENHENHENQKETKKLLDIPMELMLQIGQFMDVRQVNVLAMCNSRLLLLFFNVRKEKIGEKKNYETQDETLDFERVQQLIWKPLVFAYYPKFEKSMNIKNWMHLLRGRLQHVKLHSNNSFDSKDLFTLDVPSFVKSKNDEKLIENCEWIYKCPLNFNDLARSANLYSVRFCNVCNKDVFKVDSMESFISHTKQGNCVAFETRRMAESVPQTKMGSCLPLWLLNNDPGVPLVLEPKKPNNSNKQ